MLALKSKYGQNESGWGRCRKCCLRQTAVALVVILMILINNRENIYYFMNGLISMFLIIWFSVLKFCPNLLWPRWLVTPSRRRTTQTSSSFTRGRRRGTSRSTSPTNFLWSLYSSRRNEWVEWLTFELSRVVPPPPKNVKAWNLCFCSRPDAPNLAQVSFYSEHFLGGGGHITTF